LRSIELLKNIKEEKKIIAAGVEDPVREKGVTKELLRSRYHAENNQPKLLEHWPGNVTEICV
jgi:hypothetical protein